MGALLDEAVAAMSERWVHHHCLTVEELASFQLSNMSVDDRSKLYEELGDDEFRFDPARLASLRPLPVAQLQPAIEHMVAKTALIQAMRGRKPRRRLALVAS